VSILLWIVIALLGVIGLIHIAGISAIRASYQIWGYPRGFYHVTGVLELLAAVLLAMTQTRLWGAALGALICLAAAATLLRSRQLSHLPAPLLLLACIGILAYVETR
jgi:hypothetical protein